MEERDEVDELHQEGVAVKLTDMKNRIKWVNVSTFIARYEARTKCNAVTLP